MARFVYMGSLSRRMQQNQRAKSITHTRLQSPAEVALPPQVVAAMTMTTPEWFKSLPTEHQVIVVAWDLLHDVLDEPSKLTDEAWRSEVAEFTRMARIVLGVRPRG